MMGTNKLLKKTDVPSPVQARFGRVWRVSEVNSSGAAIDVGAIDIRFDLTGLGSITPSDLRLLIDSDNDGLLNDETPISGATNVSGNIYQFSGVTAIANNVRFTLGTINTSQTPLPIELISFTATSTDENSVKLSWQTASELDNDYFTIERSKNASDWYPIFTVEGAGNSSSLLSYHQLDETPYQDISYYRLKQTDFDGEFKYSKIKSVKINQFNSLQISPNPTNSLIHISGSNKIELSEIRLYNTLGQDVTNLTKLINEDDKKLVIDLSRVNSGLYYIKTKTEVNKIYKQ
jgi:hypothetical protein